MGGKEKEGDGKASLTLGQAEVNVLSPAPALHWHSALCTLHSALCTLHCRAPGSQLMSETLPRGMDKCGVPAAGLCRMPAQLASSVSVSCPPACRDTGYTPSAEMGRSVGIRRGPGDSLVSTVQSVDGLASRKRWGERSQRGQWLEWWLPVPSTAAWHLASWSLGHSQPPTATRNAGGL